MVLVQNLQKPLLSFKVTNNSMVQRTVQIQPFSSAQIGDDEFESVEQLMSFLIQTGQASVSSTHTGFMPQLDEAGLEGSIADADPAA